MKDLVGQMIHKGIIIIQLKKQRLLFRMNRSQMVDGVEAKENLELFQDLIVAIHPF